MEFALLLGPFLLLIFGVVETSRALWTKDALQDVAGITARCVGVGQLECGGENPSESDAEMFAREQAASRGVTLLPASISIATGTECNGISNAVLVQLQADFESILPMDRLFQFAAEACFTDWISVERTATP